MIVTQQNCMTEFSMRSGKAYGDTFNQIEVDVVFTGPDGSERIVPTFWAGENVWRVRFSSPLLGRHSYRATCSDTSNADLHGREGAIEVIPYTGVNRLLRHGPLRVSESRTYLEHLDGTPFFWLGDTWWMAFCKRLKWPGEFQMLTADRVAKGFTLIQIVAGLYPDMPPFDERGANEAGFPWEEDYARINPAYFDMADLRINWLVESGLVPCIVACWGWYIEFARAEVLKKHWRYLVARWGAYPVVWCTAGEVLMPWSWYLQEPKDKKAWYEYKRHARADWIEVARYLWSIDPYGHPVTAHPEYGHPAAAHPGAHGSRGIHGDELVDIEMLQTGHDDCCELSLGIAANTVLQVTECVARNPRIPVINGEVAYEGIGEGCRQEVQRFMFWVCMLSGAAGHTYGANGIWQFNTCEQPFGPSPHGMTLGNTPWEDAYRLPGSKQLGIAKRLLERYEWWRMVPVPESVEPHWTPENYLGPYAADISGQCRIVFLPKSTAPLLKDLEPNTAYHAFYFDPTDGRQYDLGIVRADARGNWQAPGGPIFQDWVLVLESKP